MNAKSLLCLSFTLTLLTVHLRADFTGYYAIGDAGYGGACSLSSQTGNSWQGLVPSDPTSQGTWELSIYGDGWVGFQRFPAAPAMPAIGFSLTAYGEDATAAFDIQIPISPTSEDGFYRFAWSTTLEPGDVAYVIDSEGFQLLTDKPGLSCGTTTLRLNSGPQGDIVGFYLSVSSSSGYWHGADLYVQGWEHIAPVLVRADKALEITSRTASLNGTVRPDGMPVTAWFEWGTTGFTSTSAVFRVEAELSSAPITASLRGLQPDTTYQCRLVGQSGTSNYTSSPIAFTTLLGGTAITPPSFTGYYAIPDAGGQITIPPLSPLSLGEWILSNSGPGEGAFWRFQDDPMPAEGFMLAASGSVVSLTVFPPNENTTPPNGLDVGPCWPPYQFLWTVDLPPGSAVWMVDARGYRLLADSPGLQSQYAAFFGQPTEGAPYGFYVQSASNYTLLHIRGLIPVTPRLDPNPPGQIATTAAKLHANVVSFGWPLNVWFEWGEGALTNRTPASPVTCGDTSASLSAGIDGLRPGTPYFFRLVGMNGSQTFRSATYSFITPRAPVIDCLQHLANGYFQFCVSGDAGSNYIIEASSDLTSWQPLVSITITNGPVQVVDGRVGLAQQLYRARSP